MNEQEQARYDDLFELSKHELTQRVMDAEDSMTAHDKEINDTAEDNARLNMQLLELRAQIDALAEELQRLKKEIQPRLGKHSPPIMVGRGINEPHFYFNMYQGKSKEYVLLALMNAESMLYRYALIRRAGIQWVIV